MRRRPRLRGRRRFARPSATLARRRGTMKHIAGSVLFVTVVTGCGARAPSSSTPAPSAASSPERALCLADVAGDTAVDRALQQHKRVIEQQPKKLDAWILL